MKSASYLASFALIVLERGASGLAITGTTTNRVSTIVNSDSNGYGPTCTVTCTPVTTIDKGTSTVTSTKTTETTTTCTEQRAGTSIITVVSTLTETDSSTTTVTSTTTSNSTITLGSTTTLATPAGFTPIFSVPSVQENGGGSGLEKGLHRREAQEYCGTTVTVTAPTSTTTCYASTITQTLTQTSTTTTAITLATEITSTDISTRTTTVTSQVTSTSAVTVISTTTTSDSSLQTAYAACAPSNLLGYVGTVQITDVFPANGDITFGTTSPDDGGLACCASCQQTAFCGGFLFAPAANNASDQGPGIAACYLLESSNDGQTCNGSLESWELYNVAGDLGIVVGNGPCAQGEYTVNS